MSWKTPKIVEIALGAEINCYACADLMEGSSERNSKCNTNPNPDSKMAGAGLASVFAFAAKVTHVVTPRVLKLLHYA